MKTKIVMIAAAIAIAFTAGCHAQVPPATTHSVVLTWGAPVPTATWLGCGTGTGQSPCVYAVYKCATNCGSTSNSTWTEITTAATRPSALTFTDSAPGAGTVNYDVETVQGTAHSDPSNVATVTVPGTPVAPPLGNPSVSQLALPLPQNKEPYYLAKVEGVKLSARVTK